MAPQVRRRAAQRLLEASDSAAAYLVKVVEDESKPDAIRLAAARDLLDRAGLGGKQSVEVEIAPAQEEEPWKGLLPKILHVMPATERRELPAATVDDAKGAVPPANSDAARAAFLAHKNDPDPMPPGATLRVDGARPRMRRRQTS